MANLVQTVVRNAAIDLMWANQAEDRQAVFKLTRLSPARGTRGNLDLPYINLAKPVADKYFVYYSLGGTWSKRLGIEDHSLLSWQRLEDVVQGEDMLAFPYIQQRLLPLTKVWLRRIETGALFFAVEIDNLKGTYDFKQDLVIRFYSNAWFFTTKAGKEAIGIRSFSGVVGDDFTGGEVISKYNEYATAYPAEQIMIFRNGYYVTNPNVPEIRTGDCFNIYHDSSIRECFDIDLKGAHYFFSELDVGRRKLLLPVPEELRLGIQWNDDIEFLLVEDQKTTPANDKGVYIPKAKIGDIRNVTTNDYSMDEKYLIELFQSHGFVDDFGNTKIRMILREPDRPEFLFKDGLNLHDFFIIPHDKRIRILKGLESAEFDHWTAANLEASDFMQFAFTLKQWDYPLKNIFNFYGNQYYSNQPYKIRDGIFRIPPSMVDGGLLLEFDKEGILLRVKPWVDRHIQLRYYPDAEVDLIRTIPGKQVFSASDLDQFSDYIDDPVTTWYEERYYKSPNNKVWTMARLGKDFFLKDGKANWNSAFLNYERRKRVADHYVYREYSIDSVDLGKPLDMFDDYSTTYTGLDFGHYYVFLNNRMLVYGVDYEIRFPQVYINSVEYADKGGENKVIILAHGAPNFNADPEVGFIERGLITTKNGFRPLLHRNRDFIVNGRLVDENKVVFDSGYKLAHNFNDRLDSSYREGALFGIDDHTNHMGLEDIEAITETQTEALQTDEFARLALDEYYPSPDTSKLPPVVIEVKHTVVSIVLRTIIDDILTGRLVIPDVGLSDLAAAVKFQPYRELLDIDISNKALEHTYIEVAAHGGRARIGVTVAEHQFIDIVNRLYLNGRCVLPQYLDIGDANTVDNFHEDMRLHATKKIYNNL
ncbi:virion structural protein [Vibrio phage C-ZP2022]|nr:virion structural protein [Vibrio phage C-ZP2022]